MPLTLAVTADLHWGHRRGGEETRALADFLRSRTPDILILAGDLGTGPHFAECLGLFAELPCIKALVPGNHDIWVPPDDPELDSLKMYDELLPHLAAESGFHYLDSRPLLVPDADLALVGSMNWYDYSWALPNLRAKFPEEEHRLHSKRFPRGRHNDANFVRWPTDDVAFTSRLVAAVQCNLDEALAKVGRAIVVTHHPPFRGLGFPRSGPPESLESILWDGFCGNQGMEDVLTRHADRIALAFCGHTHRAREGVLGAMRGYNIGSDYPFKRLLWIDWPACSVEAHVFGDPTPIG